MLDLIMDMISSNDKGECNDDGCDIDPNTGKEIEEVEEKKWDNNSTVDE